MECNNNNYYFDLLCLIVDFMVLIYMVVKSYMIQVLMIEIIIIITLFTEEQFDSCG